MVESLKNKEASFDRKLGEINEKCADLKHMTKSFDSKLRKLEIQEIEDGQDLTLEQYAPEALEEVDMNYLRGQNSKVDEHERQRPNLRAIQEYRERNKVYNERVKAWLTFQTHSSQRRLLDIVKIIDTLVAEYFVSL